MKTITLHPLPATPRTAAPGAPGASGNGPGGAPADMRWRLQRLLSAPHRLGFLAGALVLAASALWWALALAARHAGVALPWAVPPPVAHALLMSLGFMPLFIVGFLFTAGPRWLGLPDVPAAALRVPVALMLGGWLLALAGFHAAAPAAALGLAAAALGWSALVLRFAGLLRASRAPDPLHARLVAAAGAAGALALWAAAAALALGQPLAARTAALAALWGFLVPTFAVVSHRMLPFFTASALPALDAWRPQWLLWTLVAVPGLEAVVVLAEPHWWPLPPALRWAQAAVEAAAGVLLLWLAVRWGLVQSLKIRLLAMLHAGFAWLGVALVLAAVSHALMAASGDTRSLGLAPLHALTMGYLGATLLAMATRVAAGHSGRPLAADDVAWALYWMLQTAALLRVAAALWPAAATPLTLAAALAWALAAVGWAWRYGGWLGRPRVDGRPG
jgi:uncharacterized protein involved in response to NO